MTTAKVSDYLKDERVVFLDVSSRQEAIDSLFNVVEEKKLVKSIDQFKNAINEREKVVTTGIGMGVAIPHAKLPDYNDFFIIVGILSQGIDWGALDGSHVRTIFMIGGPDDKQTEYLQILSGLTLALKDEERRKKLLNTKSSEDIIELFQEF